MRYRLDVVAADVADVVKFAGGWLFDRAMAGWDVTVLVADHPDERPLQILGVQIVDLEYALATAGDGRLLRPWRLRRTFSAVIPASARVSCRRLTKAPPKSPCGVRRGRPSWKTASAWSNTG